MGALRTNERLFGKSNIDKSAVSRGLQEGMTAGSLSARDTPAQFALSAINSMNEQSMLNALLKQAAI